MRSLLILFALFSFSFGQWTFNDFTGHLNDSTKGKWVFGSGYAGDKGTCDYVGQDWSQGGAVLGSELVTNGGFDTDTDWTRNYWVISGGTAHLDGSQIATTTLFQENVLAINSKYQITFNYTRSAGEFRSAYYGSGYVYITPFLSESSESISIIFATNNTCNGKIYFQADVDFAGTLDNVTIKQLTSGNHLTPSTGFDYASQLTGISPVYENDNALAFDGLNDYWYIPDALANVLEPALNADFTLTAWIKTSGTSDVIIVKFDSTTSTNIGYQWLIDKDGKQRFLIGDGDAAFIAGISNLVCNDDSYNYIVVTADRNGNATFYLNGAADGTLSISTQNKSLANALDFYISRNNASNGYFNGEISSVTYHAKALTADEIKENYALGIDWYSENAIVIRDTMDWFQGFADTVYTSTGITGGCKITFNAWGQNGGETLEVWSGSTSRSFTLTDTKSSYSASLQMADGLYFASADTVYIDDVKSGELWKKGYLQYLQYLGY